MQRPVAAPLAALVSEAGTYCKPTRLKVRRAMRVASDRPRMRGSPDHTASCVTILATQACRL